MRYKEKTFTLPVSGKVTQKEWERIFGKRERRESGPRMSDIEREVIKKEKRK